MLPYGVRTFLPPEKTGNQQAVFLAVQRYGKYCVMEDESWEMEDEWWELRLENEYGIEAAKPRNVGRKKHGRKGSILKDYSAEG